VLVSRDRKEEIRIKGICSVERTCFFCIFCFENIKIHFKLFQRVFVFVSLTKHKHISAFYIFLTILEMNDILLLNYKLCLKP